MIAASNAYQFTIWPQRDVEKLLRFDTNTIVESTLEAGLSQPRSKQCFAGFHILLLECPPRVALAKIPYTSFSVHYKEDRFPDGFLL